MWALGSSSQSVGSTYKRFVAVWLGAAALGALIVWQLDRQHRAGIDNILSQSLAAHQLSWHAIQVQHKDSIAIYYDEYVKRPEVIQLLRDAQRPELRDESRDELLELLAPAYETLAARGIGLFHFHLADGESFLRLHAPEQFGDDLAAVRESIRLVNQQLTAVHGFEAGRHAAGYRSVFPIIDNGGTHLGSVEFSVPFTLLIEGLEILAPSRSFQILLDREIQENILLADRLSSYQPWPGSDQFVIPATAGSTEETIIQNVPVESLSRAIGNSSTQVARLSSPDPDAWRMADEFRGFVTTKEVLSAPDDSTVGLLLSYSPEPALNQLDQAFRFNILLTILGMLALGFGAHSLVRITSLKLAERERLNLLTHSLGQGMYATDEHGVITEVNPRACKLLGYSPEEMVGQSAHTFFRPTAAEEAEEKFGCSIINATAQGERFTGEKTFRRCDGENLEVSITSVPLTEQAGAVTLFDDITRQKANERKLQHIAHYDALTGLPNRVLLADRLSQAMSRARRTRIPLALAFIDLDGFKAVNDSHGHDAGDQLLIRLSQRMQRCVREADTIARLGGDEFAVLMSDMSELSDYTKLLKRLLSALAGKEMIDGNFVRVSASIGVTLYPQALEIDADQLLRQADQAMYEAKVAGKNQYRVFDVERDSELRGHHAQAEQVRSGLDNNEFILYYQPKVNMLTGKVIGAEALIRWQHPEHGLLTPRDFLPLISRLGLDVTVGRWVLRRALSHMLAWQRAGLALPVSVNIAGDHIQHPDFVAELKKLLGKYEQVNPSHLQLEIVESTALDDVGRVSEVIRGCAALGVGVALDDFGTGYSSLTYLKRLPARVLKMDRSFVQDMLRDPDDLAILDGVLKLASAFGLHCVAEGVSSPQHGRVLLQLGCHLAQGYAIARPMPAAGLLSWIKQWKAPEDWSQVRPLDTAGLALLHAEVEQHAWVDGLVNYLKGTEETPLPSLDNSRLGRLISGSQSIPIDRARLGELTSLHQDMQALAAEMTRARSERDMHAALARVPELETLRDKVISHLQDLALPARAH
jgi:diguanylate cyclase (GGDEF)-like protein/PAS domain S-box-containing protein